MVIFGQQKLLDKVNSYTLESLPKSLLFVGENGCGKHLFANYLANKLALEINIIDEVVDADQLIDFSQKPIETAYIINLNKIDARAQNKLLKFIEQPSKYVYVMLLTDTLGTVLPTIRNRCQELDFEPYKAQDLKDYCEWQISNPNDLVYKVCTTPGQLSGVDGENIKKLYGLCDTIVNHIYQANYANTLKILGKINFAENYDKFDFDLFFKMLKYVAFEDYKKNNNLKSLQIFDYTSARLVEGYTRFKKDNFMINFLDGLWRLTH